MSSGLKSYRCKGILRIRTQGIRIYKQVPYMDPDTTLDRMRFSQHSKTKTEREGMQRKSSQLNFASKITQPQPWAKEVAFLLRSEQRVGFEIEF